MKRVLVIDDDLLIGRLLREHLSEEGFSVETETLAEDGFNAALHDPPDLIMLDVNLPDATGFQMCGRFRQHPVTRTIPIVMMTGAARYPNQQLIGRQMGANDYILKPFDVIKVGEKVHALLGTTPVHPSGEEKEDPAPKKSDSELAPAPAPAAAAPSPEKIKPEPVVPIRPAPMSPPAAGEARPDGRPTPVPAMTPLPAMGARSFEASTAPSLETPPPPMVPVQPIVPPAIPVEEKAAPHFAIETNGASTESSESDAAEPEPIWYELPLGSIHDTTPETPPIAATPPLIHYSTENSTVQIEHEDPETPVEMPAEQLEAPLIEEPLAPTPFEAETVAVGHDEPQEELDLPPYNDAVADPPPIVIESEPTAETPVETPSAPWRAPAWFNVWRLAWSLFGVHALLVGIGGMVLKAPWLWIFRGLTFTVGGWGLLLGVLMVVTTLLKIPLAGQEAIEMLGFAAIPMVVRAIAGVYIALTEPKSFVHFMGESAALSSPIFWSHPLDIFQVVALVVIGCAIRRRPTATPKKALAAAVMIGAVWALLGRGYFKPF